MNFGFVHEVEAKLGLQRITLKNFRNKLATSIFIVSFLSKNS